MFTSAQWRLVALVGLLGITLPRCAAGADDVRSTEPTHPATSQTLRINSALGMSVRSPAGDDLGRVDDLLFDVPSGRIDYAILSHGGFLGLGDKLFPIPWREMTLHFDQGQNYFVVDATPEFLSRLPSFDREHWPDERAGWQELVESFFPIHRGIVQSAGDGRIAMSFTQGGAAHTHAVAEDAIITRDGKPIALDDLRYGDHVTVTTVEQAGIRGVTKIEARSGPVFDGYRLDKPEVP